MNREVVPDNTGRPTPSPLATPSMRPRSSSVRMTPVEFTPRTYSTSIRLIGCLYATMASASRAGPDSRDVRGTVSKRSRYGANSGLVMSCTPSATSRSSNARPERS